MHPRRLTLTIAVGLAATLTAVPSAEAAAPALSSVKANSSSSPATISMTSSARALVFAVTLRPGTLSAPTGIRTFSVRPGANTLPFASVVGRSYEQLPGGWHVIYLTPFSASGVGRTASAVVLSPNSGPL